jgi:hypothetical protein
MEFVCEYNSWVSNRSNRSLRGKIGYVKSKNVGGTGKPGYVRSVAMAAKNSDEIRTRGEHHAEQRQEHANNGGAQTAQRANGPSRTAPDPEPKMDGTPIISQMVQLHCCDARATHADIIMHCATYDYSSHHQRPSCD